MKEIVRLTLQKNLSPMYRIVFVRRWFKKSKFYKEYISPLALSPPSNFAVFEIWFPLECYTQRTTNFTNYLVAQTLKFLKLICIFSVLSPILMTSKLVGLPVSSFITLVPIGEIVITDQSLMVVLTRKLQRNCLYTVFLSLHVWNTTNNYWAGR